MKQKPAKKQKKTEIAKKTGPEPERLKLTGNWEKLMGKALKKPRPKSGWPKPKAKKQAARKG